MANDDKAQNLIAIRCHIKGYGKSDKPLSLAAVFDVDSNIIAIREEKKYDTTDTGISPKTGKQLYTVLTNDRYMHHREFLYEESNISESIDAYFEFKNTLDIAPNLGKYNPESAAIQVSGLKETGRDYLISFDVVNNGIMAVLAICLFARRQKAIANALSYTGFDGEPLFGEEDDFADVITID